MREITIRNLTLGDGIPKICIPVTAHNPEELREQTKQLLAGPCDLVEWRADFFDGVQEEGALESALDVLRGQLGEKPLLFTFRTKEEGGEQAIALDDYVRLNERAAVSGKVDLIDIELNRGRETAQRLIRSVQESGVRAVCSFHDFAQTPPSDELLRILCSMQALGADVTKVAVMPRSRSDVMRLLEVSVSMREQYADRPFITMSMSALGSISRVAGAFDGSAVTFATAGHASAPGQLEADALDKILQALSRR